MNDKKCNPVVNPYMSNTLACPEPDIEQRSESFEILDLSQVSQFLRSESFSKDHSESIVQECLKNLNCVTEMNAQFVFQIDQGS